MKSSNPHSGCREVETAQTLVTSKPCPADNRGGIAVVGVHPDVSGTLVASGAGMSRPAGLASETDLCVAYCLQGNMIGRQDHNGPRGGGVNEDLSFTLTSADVAAVAAVDCRNLCETEEVSGTLQAKAQGYSLNYQNPVRSGYIVRRLLPVECERLQGYPDGWTEFGCDGKEISDTRRYQMLGNSVAVPCVAYIMLGIMEQLKKEADRDGLCPGAERPHEN
jgi:DNA (cytosine-5)-methyltransferase 1